MFDTDYDTENLTHTQFASAPTFLAGRYQVVKPLGQGAMGSVWLARDRQLDNRLFAIKMLPSILLSSKQASAQLKKEAVVALNLSHPNIVTVRAYEENGGNPFIVMDYVEGQTLEAYLQAKGSLTEDETRKLLSPIASAIDYANGAGVIHRDIKPANVIIRKDGNPFIFDFGIAREMQDAMKRLTGQDANGTPLYMSPEQLNGDVPTSAQDVYSFAVMAYECLNGKPPFSSGDIADQIKHKQPEPLANARRLGASIMRGLAKSPEKRPLSCAAVLGAAENAKTYGRKDREDNKGGLGKIVAAGLIFAAVAGGFYAWQTRQAEVEQREPPKEEEAKEPAAKAEATRKFVAAYDAERYFEAAALIGKIELDDKEVQYKLGNMHEYGLGGLKKNAEEAVKWYGRSADQDYAPAQASLGYMYSEGLGVEKDSEEAARWYRKAAENGDELAENNLANMYTEGVGVGKDSSEAAKWFRKAAENGLATAQLNLACMYYEGIGVGKDNVEAAKWFRKAAENGDACAQALYGHMCEKGLGVPQNYVEAVKWYRMAAENGNEVGQNNLGKMYLDGMGVGKDYSEAVKWFRKAAENGLAFAQYNLGTMYYEGIGFAKDFAEAAKWFLKAADMGNAEAQALYGHMCEKGLGVPQNFDEAVKWYRMAAEKGQAAAQYNLGTMYYDGSGVDKDLAEAVKWLKMAAKQGQAEAQALYGHMCEKGLGVPQDYVEAVKWYRMAAENGNVLGQNNLAIMYYNGSGVDKDLAEAIKWFKMAAKQGQAEARQSLRNLGESW